MQTKQITCTIERSFRFQLLMEKQCTRKSLKQPRVLILCFALGREGMEPFIKQV